MTINIENLIKSRAQFIVQKNRAQLRPHPISVLGLDLIVMPEVFSPEYGEGSKMLGQCLKGWPRENESVLEIGTGTGILAILAAAHAESVIATDICYNASSCARSNINKHGLSGKISVRQGDLFAPIETGSKFSLIIFNLPFMETSVSEDEDSDLLRAMYDPGHRTLKRFFEEVTKYLSDKGRVLLAFSNCGDVALMERLIKEQGFISTRITETHSGLEFYVYELKKNGDASAWLTSPQPEIRS